MRVRKVIVTGSSGFIGSRLCDRLRDSGFDVHELDLQSRSKSLNFVEFDLIKSDPVKIFQRIRPNVVIHLGAQTDVLTSFDLVEKDFLTNAFGTIRIVEASIKCGCENFIYINSGGAIYSNLANLPIKEDSLSKPISPYGLSKLTGEAYLEILAKKYDLPWTSLALSNCYGPVGENPKGVIYQFWKSIMENKQPYVNGKNVTRDFIYVEDVISAIVLSIDKALNSRVNISSAVETRIVDLYQVVADEMNSSLELEIRPPILGEVARSALDNQRAQALLGWSPKVTLESGVVLSIRNETNET